MTKKDRAADLRLRREFHITLEEYNKVLAYQGNRCAICKRPTIEFKNRLAVDHRHSDGLLRGLLCYPCNKRWFRDIAQLYFNAYEYLSHPPLHAALGGRRYTAAGRIGTKVRAKVLKSIQERDGRFKSYKSPIR